ncbi:MAG TPA: DUF255 domain-containing protein [Candidatus Binatia bacterium]|nr:DUF255 domain-containing protein [Candidatus Binatia bacterium]
MLRFSPNANLAHLVHWFEWEEDAFRKANQQDKPVMLFLSAFWCGYCQRMDEGAFSDRENMALLNAYFVALRVENATRPDIDVRYNLNGWPTIAFFTPGGELLAAANYLPADEFKDLLLNVYMSYQQQRDRARAKAAGNEIVATHARPKRSYAEILDEITVSIMTEADRVHGGYGRGQKFIHSAASDFLLSRYEITQEVAYLEHVRRTLAGMRDGQIHDDKDGGYFRTTTGPDWSQPHREKLLSEQAGLLSNCLSAFRVTGAGEYARMADEIIGYLDAKLFDAGRGAFFGCEDFLRRETGGSSSADELFSITDKFIYTDANALAASAYLKAATLLNRPECKERALNILDFLWNHCRTRTQGLFHYHDGAPRVPGLLNDQAQMGIALVQAYFASGDSKYVDRALESAELIIERLTNATGGYFDLVPDQTGLRRFQLTDVDQNGAAASFFLSLAQAADDTKYRESARWALDAFDGDFSAGGVQAARFGRALIEYLSLFGN